MRRSLLALLVAALPLTAALVAACDGASPSHTASPGSCTLTPLAAAGTGDNDAGAFNASGVVIGRAAQTPGSPPQPVIWRAGTATPIPLPPAMTGGNAADINDRGEVVGTLTDADGATHAYHWDGTYLTLLKGLPGGTSTYARRINARARSPARHTLATVTTWPSGGKIRAAPRPPSGRPRQTSAPGPRQSTTKESPAAAATQPPARR